MFDDVSILHLPTMEQQPHAERLALQFGSQTSRGGGHERQPSGQQSATRREQHGGWKDMYDDLWQGRTDALFDHSLGILRRRSQFTNARFCHWLLAYPLGTEARYLAMVTRNRKHCAGAAWQYIALRSHERRTVPTGSPRWVRVESGGRQIRLGRAPSWPPRGDDQSRLGRILPFGWALNVAFARADQPAM